MIRKKASACAGHLLHVWEIRQYLLADFSCESPLCVEKQQLYKIGVNFRF